MTSENSGQFEVLEGYPNDVVAIAAKGHITREAYEKTLIPLVEERIAAQGKIKLLYVLGEGFEGVSAGAAWDDAKLGLMHLADFARIGIVTEVEWIRMGVKMFAPLMRCPVALFGISEMEAAKAWILKDAPEAEHKPGVAATHKLPLMEDKMPPNP